jgi:hypothetical protein
VWTLSGSDSRFPGPSSHYALNYPGLSLVDERSDVSLQRRFVRFEGIRAISMKTDAVWSSGDTPVISRCSGESHDLMTEQPERQLTSHQTHWGSLMLYTPKECTCNTYPAITICLKRIACLAKCAVTVNFMLQNLTVA